MNTISAVLCGLALRS